MDKDDNKLCDKCGLLPQSPVQPKPPVCKRKKKCCKKDCCENEFAFRKVVIPAALGDDVTGKDKPENGAYTNSYVEYEANGAQYMYDSYGVYTKIEGGGGSEGTFDFNELENRPKYAGEEMTGETDIPNVNTAVAAEATLREAADTALSEDIAAETLARQNADSGLQTQIDAISASSDVTDIVGTYAALQAYDTSTLSNNDIIKVLQDEEHDNETTYYRWSTATQTFTLIGEEGPYYTKSAADAKFQDKLTAGANVSIDQSTNTISATDTVYNDFTGTDGVDAGTAGLVPAPAVSDAGKYLKADGTWDSVSGGIPTNATFWEQSYDSVNNKVDGAMVISTSTGGLMPFITAKQGSATKVVFSSRASGGLRIDGGGGSWCIVDNSGLNLGGLSITKRVQNMADPVNLQDAATKNYTDNLAISYAALNGTAAPTTATEGKYVGQLYYDTTNEQLYFLKEIDSTTTPATYTWEAVGGSSVNVVQTIGTSTTDVMSQKAATNMIFPEGSESTRSNVLIGSLSSTPTNLGTYNIRIGSGIFTGTNEQESIVIGHGAGASVSASNSVSIGHSATAKSESVAIGHSAAAAASTNTVAIGHSAQAFTSDTIAVGSNIRVANTGSVVIGNGYQNNTQYTTRNNEFCVHASTTANQPMIHSNVDTPTLGTDAANKQYVDNAVASAGAATYTPSEFNNLWENA